MRKASALLWGLWLVSCVGSAVAAELEVRVVDGKGQPVSDAVVTVVVHGAASQPQREMTDAAPARHVIDQKGLVFTPYVEVFRPGDEVTYRNSDRTRHHVYSFSPIKAFEFVLAPGAVSTPMKLERSGVIAVGCNIHDGMINYLYVTDAPVAARTDSRGRVVFEGLGEGRYNVRVWQPRLPAGRPDLREKSIALAAGETKTLAFPLKLRPDPRRQFDREHTHY